MATHDVRVVQHGDHGAALLVQAAEQRHELIGGMAVHGCKGLVQQQHRCVLHQHAREQRALHLAAGQGIQAAARRRPGPRSPAPACSRRVPRHGRRWRRPAARRPSPPAPAPSWENCDPARRPAAATPDRRGPRQRFSGCRPSGQHAHDAFDQRGLAGAVRTDHRGHAAGGEAAGYGAQHRMPMPAEGDLVEFDGGVGDGATGNGPGRQRGAHAPHQPSAQLVNAHRPPAASAAAMRRHAEARKAGGTRRRAGVAPGLGGRSVKWDIRRKTGKGGGRRSREKLSSDQFLLCYIITNRLGFSRTRPHLEVFCYLPAISAARVLHP